MVTFINKRWFHKYKYCLFILLQCLILIAHCNMYVSSEGRKLSRFILIGWNEIFILIFYVSEYQNSLDACFSELNVQRNYMVVLPFVTVKSWVCTSGRLLGIRKGLGLVSLASSHKRREGAWLTILLPANSSQHNTGSCCTAVLQWVSGQWLPMTQLGMNY